MNIHFSKKGFTLIEMLVSVALFSIVLLVTMGSIMTIVDVNRKSQTLTTVMNDLNFSLENMTRSIKTGQIADEFLESSDSTNIIVTDQEGEEIEYEWDKDNGAILRNDERITSEQIDIDRLLFRVFQDVDNRQPRVLMVIEGTATLSNNISSNFVIQTTVSQRDLETDEFI